MDRADQPGGGAGGGRPKDWANAGACFVCDQTGHMARDVSTRPSPLSTLMLQSVHVLRSLIVSQSWCTPRRSRWKQ
jgi:hypothetical protein